MKSLVVTLALIVMTVCAASALAETKKQQRDPRIDNATALALINMDPVDVNYRTNYDTHITGVLLVPSPGPIKGKKGWYTDLAVPAGVHVDFPKSATVEPYEFRAPNGETITDAVKVTLEPGTESIVFACGNGHKPKGPMLMKLVEPLVETRIEVQTKEVEVIKEVPVITDEGLKRAAAKYEPPQPRFTLSDLIPDICKGSTLRNLGCTAAAVFGGYLIYDAVSDSGNSTTCNNCY